MCTIGQITKFYPGDQLDKVGKPAIATWTDVSTILYIKSESQFSEKCLESFNTRTWMNSVNFLSISACGCNLDGTTKDICDEDTGVCNCKSNFSGDKCEILGIQPNDTL